MNLLISEPPLQVLPSLAKNIGLNEAILLQQLHYRSLISTNIKDGYRWVYKTFEEWQEEFPFWSVKTIKRTVKKLEDEGYVISTSAHNKMKMDRTKWYRIDYSKCVSESGQTVPTIGSNCPNGEGQSAPNVEDNTAPCHRDNMTPPITKEIKSNKKDIVENDLDVAFQIIDYLNEKTGKRFKASSSATKKLINGRLSDGYTLEDFKSVIDSKANQWLNDPQFNNYLRPSTLFNATNFENYLNENFQKRKLPASAPYQPPQLDFGRGEE
ncbi:hypothetical protein OXB_3009 [Bacillus sp. OxB-1]|uniref:conserved phage C-terminal domain-containing protein n=1 Tax=Bacillus sp. (strain OxB-1) TaxID=98228 RepID=UPI000581C704|nr:conserved phage C-terminal domain-containing protein [Bacillus sp. OxB-1]BAQ11479.1 hypothetical protein OXB_3009 [Bacillus sp. OxB-1]